MRGKTHENLIMTSRLVNVHLGDLYLWNCRETNYYLLFQHHIAINRALPALTAFRKGTSCKIYNIHSAIVELFCKILCGRVDQFAFTWVNVLVKLEQTPSNWCSNLLHTLFCAKCKLRLNIQCLLPTVTPAILCTPNTCIIQNRAKVLIMRRPQDKVDALTSISTVIYVNIR